MLRYKNNKIHCAKARRVRGTFCERGTAYFLLPLIKQMEVKRNDKM